MRTIRILTIGKSRYDEAPLVDRYRQMAQSWAAVEVLHGLDVFSAVGIGGDRRGSGQVRGHERRSGQR